MMSDRPRYNGLHVIVPMMWFLAGLLTMGAIESFVMSRGSTGWGMAVTACLCAGYGVYFVRGLR